MKKTIITILAAVLAFGVVANAQDGRQRTVQTIVADVLAQMPPASAADNNVQMKDLAASAPESVIALAGMLQAPEKGANNLIEYAITGVCRFAASPENRSTYLAKVKSGLEKAVAACQDPTNKQYLESELKLMQAAPAPVKEVYDVKSTVKEAKSLLKSDKANLKCKALYLLDKVQGADASKTFISSLKSDNRAFRTTALNYLSKYADDAAFAKVVKAYKALKTPEAKEDVLNWLGDNKVASQADFVISQIKDSNVAAAAIEAAGKIGTESCADALWEAMGNEATSAAALKAIKSFKGNISDRVAATIAQPSNAVQKNAIVALASAKGMKQLAPKIISIAANGDSNAINALAGVASVSDIPDIANLLDRSSEANRPALYKAFASAVSSLSADDSYKAVKTALNAASNPELFYFPLAGTNTDASVDDLVAAAKNGSKEALQALKTSANYKAADFLLENGPKDEDCFMSYLNLVWDNEKNIDRKTDKFVYVLENCNADKTRMEALENLSYSPTLKAFNVCADWLDNPSFPVARKAAYGVRSIAKNCDDDLDYAGTKAALEKAIGILKNGNNDDDYAADEIKSLLPGIVEPSPVYVLTPEEEKAGYELLFDGTNLDKWVGNKDGYRIVNNAIYVSAGYGNNGNLYTEKEYKDFVFRFEFSFVRPGANNGIGVRAPLEGDAAYVGMCEVQVLDHDNPMYANLNEYQVHGSVYGVIPAKRIVHKPLGEWSTEEIRVKGNHITVTVNGEVIVDGDVKEACQGHNVAPDGSNSNPYTVDHRNHPGMFNKTGHVGFLGHGPGVKFRNVRILDLNKR